jgi:imidazolonepropionase-like amidohydrolase
MNRWIVLAATVGSAFALFACSPPTHAPRSGLVVSNVTIVSAERAAPLARAYVRILDGRIAEISEQPLRGEQEIDGTGRYLTPGLIDSHTHLAVSPGFPSAMTAAQAAAHPVVVAATLAQDPKSYLFFGFTTVVDLVGSGDRTAQWNALQIRPDAFFCGAAATIQGQTRVIRYPYFSYGKTFEERIVPTTDPSQNTPDAVVARIAADGAICIKTIYDRGLEPTVEEGRALVAAAHARNLPVFIHANRRRSQAFAVAAGVDAIVHGMWREPNEEAALDDEARGILADIVRARIGYQPTTQVIVGELDMLRGDYFTRPELTDVYPEAFIDWCAPKQNGCAATHWSRGAGARSEARVQGTISRAAEVTRVLAAADANLLFGSDTPSDMVYTNPPGLNARLEMNNWIAAGVSEHKLFRALTIDNARMLRLDDKVGTVEQGKIANLLLLRANPLQDVKAFDTIETVFLHGRPIARAELSARHARDRQAPISR